MVQESPKKRKSVLVLVTNHALYVLTLPRGLPCTVCESWKVSRSHRPTRHHTRHTMPGRAGGREREEVG
eukprot:1135126-Prymnesium_polylepis.1